LFAFRETDAQKEEGIDFAGFRLVTGYSKFCGRINNKPRAMRNQDRRRRDSATFHPGKQYLQIQETPAAERKLTPF
jgi:hypothetical protein